jgi:hypothetical protein
MRKPRGRRSACPFTILKASYWLGDVNEMAMINRTLIIVNNKHSLKIPDRARQLQRVLVKKRANLRQMRETLITSVIGCQKPAVGQAGREVPRRRHAASPGTDQLDAIAAARSR